MQKQINKVIRFFIGWFVILLRLKPLGRKDKINQLFN